MGEAPTHLEGYCDGMAGKTPQLRPDDTPYYDGWITGAMDRAYLDPPIQLDLDFT